MSGRRLASAAAATGGAAGGAVAIFAAVARTDGTLSMVLGLAGVLTVTGAAMTLLALSLE